VSHSDDPAVALARQIRLDVVRMTSRARASHVGSALSIADIVAVLYSEVLNISPSRIDDEARDRFILSKGHGGCAIYSVLARSGFYATSELDRYCQNGSHLSGHLSHRHVRGVEFSTGSLGHGPSVAAGMAFGARRRSLPTNVFCIVSDGECDEGSVWEAALFAGHHQLSNLTLIIDYNRIQSLGATREILDLDPLPDKWLAFGWEVAQVDGHDIGQLRSTLTPHRPRADKPLLVVANTTKGKGVSFMENSVHWHYKSASVDELRTAEEEIRYS